MDARARQVFEREVGSWVALGKHPNIVWCMHMEEEALADYGQAIRLNPELAAAYYNRGNT